jgi:peptidoglycan/LPS O-acetylase OafA/YrhL
MKTIGDFAESRENNFDFIRFVAASAVIFSHSFPLTYDEIDMEPMIRLSHGRYTTGEMAVSIFFIISGFLVTQSFQRSKDLKNYFLARALRIFPALIAVVMVLVFVAGPMLSELSFKDYFTAPGTYHYLLRMTIFTDEDNTRLPGVFAHNPYAGTVNGSLWTLSYEVVCYLAVPAIALLFHKRKWLPALLLLAACIVLSINFFLFSMFLKLSSCFLSGALFYIFRKKIPLNSWLALVNLALLIISFRFDFFPYTLGLFGGYIILYLSYVPKSALFRFSKHGDFSYGIYIWAFPVQQFIASHYASKGNYFNAGVSFLVTLILGILSWHLVEKRALQLKKKMLKKKKENQ